MVASHSIQGLRWRLHEPDGDACAQEKSPHKPARRSRPWPNPAPRSIPSSSAWLFLGCGEAHVGNPGRGRCRKRLCNGDIAGRYEAVLAHERKVRMGLSGKRNHAEVVKVRFDPRRPAWKKC